MSERIEITVDPRGGVRVETKGFAGRACQEASRFLEAALGRRTAEQRTSAYYQSAHRQQQQERQGNG